MTEYQLDVQVHSGYFVVLFATFLEATYGFGECGNSDHVDYEGYVLFER